MSIATHIRRAVVVVACLHPIAVAYGEVPANIAGWLQPQVWQRDVEGPIVSLGADGAFDDRHIFAPTVARIDDQFWLWYCGSRGTPGNRVFRLGLATSADGKRFQKSAESPVLEFKDGVRSIITPALLRDGNGNVLREDGKLRMWFASTAFGKSRLHTLHESTSADGIHWAEPSPVLLENVYCPTVLKTGDTYQMWYSDVSQRPWLYRHATSRDGRAWTVAKQPVLQLSQPWEAEVLVYPTVLQVDGVYLMWYGSYDNAVRRETTAIGFAASADGIQWHKHPQNPVLRPDPARPWESNYVGSGCVMRLADGSFRYWYASRKQPPFENLYFAINTARWAGPGADRAPLLRLPPEKGDTGGFAPATPMSGRNGRSVDVLEIVDAQNMIVRAWYLPSATPPADRTVPGEPTYVDLWVKGVDTAGLSVGDPVKSTQAFQVTGSKSFDTTCGGRSVPLVEPLTQEQTQPTGKK